MDPEFMTRYLDQHSADREENQGRKGEPVSEPDIGETPSVSEPGADLERAQREEHTAVLPPDVVAQVRAQLPGPGRAPQQAVPPTPPAPPTARIEPSGADVGEPGRPGEGGTHARAAATDPAAPDVEGSTVPVAHTRCPPRRNGGRSGRAGTVALAGFGRCGPAAAAALAAGR